MRRAASWTLRASAIVFALLIAPYSVMQTRTYDADPDIWWHIRVGDWIATHHAWPRHGIFSQHDNLPWTAYSWGFDLLVAGAHRLFGLPGIPGLLLAIEIVISLMFLLAMWRIVGRFWPAWVLGTVAIFAFYTNPLRPSLLTLLFFTLELLVIFDSERTEDDKRLYWLLPIFLVWANCHIQFVYGIAVLGLYVAARSAALLWPRVAGGGEPRGSVAFLAKIFGLVMLATCVGPNWFLPYLVALRYTGQTFVYQIIQEMRALSFRAPADYCVLVLLMAACYAAAKSAKRDFFRIGLLILCAAVSFRSRRDTWFVAMAAAFVIAEAIREHFGKAASEDRQERERRSERAAGLAAFAAATVITFALSFAYAIHEGISTRVMIEEIDRVYPIRAAEYVRDARLQGPMFNSFNFGGFLIFNLPEYPVSMDPRTDLYGDAAVRRSVSTTDAISWQTDPDLQRANFVIIERYFSLAGALAHSPDYNLVYQDQLAMVFVKTKAAQ